jgi:hypothetical protein
MVPRRIFGMKREEMEKMDDEARSKETTRKI